MITEINGRPVKIFQVTTPDGTLHLINCWETPEREAAVVAKHVFALELDMLTIDDMPDAVRTRFINRERKGVPDDELTWCRQNIHLSERVSTPKLTVSCECTPTDIPSDSYFRSVWEFGDDATPIKINMPKARGIHMDNIRQVRNAELAAKDITFMRAVEAGDTSAQATIGAEKQTLRDIPQTFDLTTDTPEELKAKWPAELPARE
jgi:hypothetical protein